MAKIILLNGPPSSGKDTAAKHIRTLSFSRTFFPGKPHFSCKLDRMSMPIKAAFAGTMGLECTLDGIVSPWEAKKEEIIPDFGISYRQWQIDFSETFLKKYDPEIFAKLLVSRIQRNFAEKRVDMMLIPDCGFPIEVQVLYESFPHDDILLIRPHRAGFDFSRDSRTYVRSPKGCAVFDPINTLQGEYLKQIEAGVRCWMETPERMGREV